jgi:hypothetical protein
MPITRSYVSNFNQLLKIENIFTLYRNFHVQTAAESLGLPSTYSWMVELRSNSLFLHLAHCETTHVSIRLE